MDVVEQELLLVEVVGAQHVAGAGDRAPVADEPLPGPLQRIAVNPFWPLLAVMFGGAWVSWHQDWL